MFLGDKCPALPSITATGDTSRREAIKHSHLPRWQREDVRLWNLGIPRGLCSEDHRRRLQAIYGGESACLIFFTTTNSSLVLCLRRIRNLEKRPVVKPICKTPNLISGPRIFSPSVSTRKGTPPPTTYAPTSGALVSRCSRFQLGSFRTKRGRRRSSNSSRS